MATGYVTLCLKASSTTPGDYFRLSRLNQLKEVILDVIPYQSSHLDIILATSYCDESLNQETFTEEPQNQSTKSNHRRLRVNLLQGLFARV